MKPKIEALLKQIKSGKIETDKTKILDFIMKHPYSTIIDIEVKLKMKIQTVSPRLSELMDLGVIEEKGVKETASSSYTYLKYQPNQIKQIFNAQKRLKEKYDNWLKKGLTQFNEFINPELKQQLECKK